MKELIFVCAQPANLYYAWQVEVLLHNFKKIGIPLSNVHIVCSVDNEIPDYWETLSASTDAKFFFYKDQRVSKNYISSIRPNILKQHWQQYPELRNYAIFYHDCDILFTKPISEWITNEMINDNVWYGSDCRWYISYSYIESKGSDVISQMCDIVGISQHLVKENEMNCIGAQYILKNVTHNFWTRVETDCENLFRDIVILNNKKVQTIQDYHALQIWCADMWAILWNAWNCGIKTVCHANMEFSWATSSEVDYLKMNIFHNAGVTTSKYGLFFKAEYINKLPYEDTIKINQHTASWYYWNEICETSKTSVLK